MQENLVGTTSGKWLVIGPVKYLKGKRAMWYFCHCECGTEKFVSRESLTAGTSTKCPCCGPRKYPKGTYAEQQVFLRYKREAKERDLSWNLDRSKFNDLAKQNCFYCSAEPSNITTAWDGSTFRYSGIDRVDNTCGYEPQNVVSCCHECNKAKGSRTQKEFIDWAFQIARTIGGITGARKEGLGVCKLPCKETDTVLV